MDAATEATAQAIRAWFREDPSRMTMMAARKFAVPERDVVDALAGGGWPVARLADDAFAPLMDALPALGAVRVFVRSRAAVIEVVGTFGGYSESGPFFNVQNDDLDMHILPAELGPAYAVEKIGHDSDYRTYSFQFFDRRGDAAFKVFLWQDFPALPEAAVAAFRDLARRLARPTFPVA